MLVSAELPVALAAIPDADAIKAELHAIVESIPFPVWPGKAKNAKHIGVITILNAMFRSRLRDHGWAIEYRTSTGRRPDAFKLFGDVRVALEVQMGNSARTAEDILKFRAYLQTGEADMSCGIYLAGETANMCAGGTATFEHFKQLLDQHPCAGMPTYVLGMSQIDTARVDVSNMDVHPEQIKQGANPELCASMAERVLAGQGLRIQPAQGSLF